MKPRPTPTKKRIPTSKPKKTIKSRPKVSLRKGFKVKPANQKIIYGQSGYGSD